MPKYESHNFSGKILNWKYCAYCGLIRLRNKRTDRAVRKGCNWREE